MNKASEIGSPIDASPHTNILFIRAERRDTP